MKLNTLRFEITILHTAMLGIVFIVFSGVLYFISQASFQRTDQLLRAQAEAVDATIKTYLNAFGDAPDALAKSVQKTIDMKNEGLFSIKLKKISADWANRSQSLNLNRVCINFFDKDKKMVISSPHLEKGFRDIFLESSNIPQGEKMTFRTLSYKHKTVRIITYPLAGDPSGEYFFQIAVAQEPIIQQLVNWLYSMIISFPLILFMTDFVGRRQAARILAPVNEITRMANNITFQDLGARIKSTHFDVEMASLIDSFNNMISRLDKSFKHIEQFSYHVAHELKTPLTIIQGEAELLLRKERSAGEYQDGVKVVMEESERVLRTIEDLLLMSKLDYQPDSFNFEPFDFVEFFEEIVEQTSLLATFKNIVIKTELNDLKFSLMIKGDRPQLRRLFFNIIGNAIKFTPQSGEINIRLDFDPNNIICSIIDTGPGIARDNLGKIFEEFYRADINAPGSGLGLNIARTIAKLHQGEIQVESKIGQGTTFKIILPRYSAVPLDNLVKCE